MSTFRLDPGATDLLRVRQALQRGGVEGAKAIVATAQDQDALAAEALQASGSVITIGRWEIDASYLAYQLTGFGDTLRLGTIPPAHKLLALAVEINRAITGTMVAPFTLDVSIQIGAKTALTVRVAEDPIGAAPAPPNNGGRAVLLFTAAADYSDLYSGDAINMTFVPGGTLALPSELREGSFRIQTLSVPMLGQRASLGSAASGGGGDGKFDSLVSSTPIGPEFAL